MFLFVLIFFCQCIVFIDCLLDVKRFAGIQYNDADKKMTFCNLKQFYFETGMTCSVGVGEYSHESLYHLCIYGFGEILVSDRQTLVEEWSCSNI